MSRLLISLLVLVSCSLIAAAYDPLASHSVLYGTPSSELLIPLGTVATHSITTYRIVSLPSWGTLYTLHPNYITYGYAPMQGSAIAAPTNLTSADSTVLLALPIYFEATSLLFEVIDSQNVTSNVGRIDILRDDGVLLSSPFHFDADSWQVETTYSAAVSWSGTSTGSLNHYIYYSDGTLPLQLGVNNTARWRFVAPSSYYSQSFINAYGGELSFWMASFAGDFTATNLYPAPIDFVQLSCISCNNGKGITLSQRGVSYDGSLTRFSFTLNESPLNGWLKDPQDVRITNWASPTACEFVSVLNGLSSIKIFGDWTREYETVGLDLFQIKNGNSVPQACY